MKIKSRRVMKKYPIDVLLDNNEQETPEVLKKWDIVSIKKVKGSYRWDYKIPNKLKLISIRNARLK